MRVLHVGNDFAALRPDGLTLYADALMQGLATRGHSVAHVFSGRVYPRLGGPRLKRWASGPVDMFELIGAPSQSHWDLGTRFPLRDLDEPAGEAAFAAAVRDFRPGIVHIQELSRLPSSIIERAREAGLPLVMSLHDYKPVCASVRLLDADGARCTRLEVGEDCARNCAGAPEGHGHLEDWTVRFELQRAKRKVLPTERLNFGALSPVISRLTHEQPAEEPGQLPPPAAPAEYQRRRDVNVERLNLCDRLIAPSQRAAEIYADLGVAEDRLHVQRLALPSIELLSPGRAPGVHAPLTFVTLGGCATPSKGSRIVLETVRELSSRGLDDRYRLMVLGSIDPEVVADLSRFPPVSLLGRYAPGELDVLDEADVGLLPSVWEEVHGFVGVEMLAKGLPVIANALGGIPEYVEGGSTGWLNRSATGAELAELMVRAIEDPAEVERLQRSVRALRPTIVRSMADHLAEVEALYAELVAP